MRHNIGFRSGVGPRVAIALVWAVVAVLVVMMLDRRDSPSTSPLPSTPAEERATPQDLRSLDIELQAGFRVEGWTVMVDGREIEAQSAGESTWSGRLSSSNREADLEIFVEARAEDHFAQHRHAMEVLLRDGGRLGRRTFWGDGDVGALIRVEELLAE